MKCTPEYNAETKKLMAQHAELRRVARGAESGNFGEAIRAKAREVIDAGERDAGKVVDKVHAFINEHAPHEKSEVAAHIAETKARTRSEAVSERAAVIAEIRDLEKVNKGLDAAEAERAGKAEGQAKARLNDQITDLSRQLAHEITSARDKGKPIDTPEIRALREKRDALKAERDRQEPSPPATRPLDPNIAKNKAEQTRIGNKMKSLEERIANRDSAPPAKKAKPQWDEKTTKMRADLKALQEQHAALEPKAEPKDPHVVREQREVKRLENEIGKLDEQIAAGEAAAKAGKVQGPESRRVAELKAERAAKQAEVDRLGPSPPATRPVDPNVAKNKARQTQLKKQLAELDRRLAENDFGPKPKVKKSARIDDAETNRLQMEVNRAKADVDKAVRMLELKHRGPFEKAWAMFMDVFRGVILSGSATLIRLSSAAAQRVIINPIEGAVGQGLKNLPWLKSRIYAHTEYEGGSLHDYFAGERAAITNTLNSAAFQEMWSKLKGDSNLKALVGGELHPDARENWGNVMGTILSLPARIHGVLKTPAEMNDFHRALERYSRVERRRAEKTMSPQEVEAHMRDQQTVVGLQLKAYLKSRESILMQDSKANDFINASIHRLKQFGPVGKVAGGALEYALPIKKVALNIFSEVTSYMGGALKTASKISEINKAAREGTRESNVLTGEEADQLARQLQKQTVGVAVAAIGWMGAEALGGMYHRGEKHKEGKPEHGEIKFGEDVTIGKEWTHSPLMETLMVAADARRAYEAAGSGFSGAAKGVGAAAAVTVRDVLNDLPFMQGPRNLLESVQSEQKMEAFAGNALGSLVPPDVRKYAQSQDVETLPSGKTVHVERKAPGALDKLMKNIPGQRQKLQKSGYRE